MPSSLPSANLDQLREATASMDLLEISRCLHQMDAATDDDTWPREVLEWLISYQCWDERSRDHDREMQTRCVRALVDRHLSYYPGPRDNRFIEKVVGEDASHLWDPLIEAGFAANGDKILDFLVAPYNVNSLSVERKVVWLEKLLNSSFAPTPPDDTNRSDGEYAQERGLWPFTVLEHALDRGDYALIPMLCAAGYTLPNTPSNRIFMAEHVASGHWPFADLLLPDFLLHEDAYGLFFTRLLMEGFSPFSFLETPAHVEKFCQLPMTDRAQVRSMFMSIIEDKRWDDWKAGRFSNPIPRDTVVCLMVLHKQDLIDLGALFANPNLPKTSQRLIEPTRPDFAAFELDKQTAAPMRSSVPSKRL